jgi:predicted transcriptional regulator
MKTLSLKLDDMVFRETEQVIGYVKKSRNRYINEALDYYNKLQKRELLAMQLEKESKLVSEDSMEILHEFEQAEDEGQAV